MTKEERLKYFEQVGEGTSLGISYFEFLSERSFKGLFYLPYIHFDEYDPAKHNNVDIQRGSVLREGCCKYCFTGDGKLNGPPSESNLCKLVRDKSRYDPDGTEREWTRGEFCLKGTQRKHNGLWYECDVDVEDSNTPPPNNERSWKVVPE